LPPIQECGELYSLNTAGNSEAEKKAVKVGLHGAQRDIELLRNLFVAATLQQQFGNLPFPWCQPD